MKARQKVECDKQPFDAVAVNEVQLILAEKRTSLAVMRTGIAVLAIPLGVTSLLIATSRYYDVLHVVHLLVPLMSLNGLLVVLGVYLVVRSFRRLHHQDRMIHEIKRTHSCIAEFID
jgi:uncharacterized membrane protein YidH (DUF202 family)